MSMQEMATRQIKTYVMLHYGNLLTTEEPHFDEENRLWKAQLKSNYPRLIKNEFPKEERYIRVLPLRRLGTVCFDENFHLKEECSTKRKASIERIRSYLHMWQEKAENIVVSNSSKQLADTANARTFLNPVNKILDNFLQQREIILTLEQLERVRSPTKFVRWLTLLEELKLIKKRENGYVYGEMFTSIERKATNAKEFQILSMAYVIKECYPILREVFGIKQFEPLVHLDSCYYRPALEAERILYQSEKTLFRRFMNEYGYKPEIDLRHYLHELSKSNALCRKNFYYYGNDELFNDMLADKEKQFFSFGFPQI